MKVSRMLHQQGRSFKIITPFDPQRSALEKALKDEKLPWEDKCYNVDSFQGKHSDVLLHAYAYKCLARK